MTQQPEKTTVWAIIFTEKDAPISQNLWDWNLGSALFKDRTAANTYAQQLNEVDTFYVHSVLELEVF